MSRMRPPETVMRLERLGSFHQCRLSFMRILLRRAREERWRFSRAVWEIGDDGTGHAVYRVDTGDRNYSLVCFAHDLPDDRRSDRVIAEAWDATFCLFDGVPTDGDLLRLAENVPKQELGRISEKELTLSRANRSVRMFAHVVDRLANGHQPESDLLAQTGYLMRTTAVYGSGKFGAADWDRIACRPEFSAPFQAEMLSVYLIREFTFDIAEHLACVKGGRKAVGLSPIVRMGLGVGNSTGLGMAPFLINHPVLLNNWIASRERAIAIVRGIEVATEAEIGIFLDRLARCAHESRNWHTDDIRYQRRIGRYLDELKTLQKWTESVSRNGFPFDCLMSRAERQLSIETQEALASLMLEPYGELVDHLSNSMHAYENESFWIDGAQTIQDLSRFIEGAYATALKTDFEEQERKHFLWYVSQAKLEPRLGLREDETLTPFEQPLAPWKDIAALHEAIVEKPPDMTIAAFLMQCPEHRHAVRRVQIAQAFPYAEIRDNTIDRNLVPIDLLRCKLSFFGATRFDPRSDRWLRICMFRGAPSMNQLAETDEDDWIYPVLSP